MQTPTKVFDVQDVINAEYTLELLRCRYCQSTEVTFHQYLSDAYCASCGRWQLTGEE